jgi:glucose/arabinose dehydrogenase
MSRSRGRSVVGALGAVLLGASLVAGPAAPAQAVATITWDRVASGLSRPTQVTSARDGSGRLFVVEQQGTVRVFRDGRLLSRRYLDLRDRVRDAGEGGLLSIAFHPRFRSHPFLWAAFTTNTGDVRVARFRAATSGAARVSASTGRKVITVQHPPQFTNHFAGQLAFGRTGLLFMSTGDGGGSGDPFDHGQSTKTLQGKLLRIKVFGARKDCGKAYCVPASNPYAGSAPGLGPIWLTGLRNTWRFSVDRGTGDLWLGDVGQGSFEEIDRVPAGVGGWNMGWSCKEGFSTFDRDRCRDGAVYRDPVAAYGRDYGSTITGGFVYRGGRFADVLGGHYVAGDFGSGRVFHLAGGEVVTAGRLPGVTSFGEDGSNELWAVTYNGGLYRMGASA